MNDVNLDIKNLSCLFIHPSNCPRSDFHIPPEFGNRVLVHIAKNFVAHVCGINIPLILAIQGSQGDGKSSQVREICSRNGIYVYPISGSFLSGSHEKEAVEVLAESYINAYSMTKQTKQLVTILIDDFDLSVASTFEEREYTVNSQLLTGFLMNLADDPTKCGKENVSRIPIVVTGNNFTALHDPLTRHGRMDFFTWVPTYDQKLEIVRHMYRSCIRQEKIDQVEKLVSEFRDEPISFFDSLKSDYLNELISKNIETKSKLNIGDIESIAKNAFSQRKIDVGILKKLAVERKAVQRRDYINRSDGQLNNQASYLSGQHGQSPSGY